MATTAQPTIVTDETIAAIREEIAKVGPEQSAALEIGCRSWRFENAEGFSGRITVWPDGIRAALTSPGFSHWGRWDETLGRIRLDNGDLYDRGGGVGEDA